MASVEGGQRSRDEADFYRGPMRSTVRLPRRLSFDVVEGLGRIYVQCMAGDPGRGLSGANDDDSVLVAVVGWHGDVW